MNDDLNRHLSYLKLVYIRENHEPVAWTAAQKQWTHVHYLAELITQESNLKKDHLIQRRIRVARFPVIKTLDQFNWSWPKKINQAQIQNLFRLKFIEDKSNVVFIGGVGLGKTHLASAVGYQACLKGHTVLFASAIDAINNLFQIISQRYEQGSIIITTNRVFKEWPKIFNNDSTLTSALLDRLLHHTDAVVIEGDSYRMKEVVK